MRFLSCLAAAATRRWWVPAVAGRAKPGLAALFTMIASCGLASARTIELGDYDCDRMAVISPQAPLSGWAATELGPGEFTTTLLDLRAERAFLVRFPLTRIPEGQRIARAEWVLPIGLISTTGAAPKLFIRRILGEWGTGVSHEFRMRRPKELKWTQPGAAGVSTDRAAQPSAVVAVPNMGELVVNVTEDVELWYTGVAENQGWIVTVEDPTVLVRLNSPLWSGMGTYKLRITYEPE
jgi:hypothetical protein